MATTSLWQAELGRCAISLLCWLNGRDGEDTVKTFVTSSHIFHACGWEKRHLPAICRSNSLRMGVMTSAVVNSSEIHVIHAGQFEFMRRWTRREFYSCRRARFRRNTRSSSRKQETIGAAAADDEWHRCTDVNIMMHNVQSAPFVRYGTVYTRMQTNSRNFKRSSACKIRLKVIVNWTSPFKQCDIKNIKHIIGIG